jgi:P-type E1-E2 ATPase
LVTFTNKLKVDAKQIINTLHSAQIKVKMITGDNIFVAVQNALVLHLVPES